MSASVRQRPKTAGSDFSTLNRQIAEAGLLERRPACHAARAPVVFALFPGMPTPNLPKAQPIVRACCERAGVWYEETSLLRSYRRALGHLHAVGAPLRAARPG